MSRQIDLSAMAREPALRTSEEFSISRPPG
jgi:hypothetical protein